MAVIKVNNAQQGQILKTDVNDRSGRVLLRAGSELSDRYIKMFKSWGVVDIEVLGDVRSDDEISFKYHDLDESFLEDLETDLNHRFRFTNRAHPLIKELYQQAIQHFCAADGSGQ